MTRWRWIRNILGLLALLATPAATSPHRPPMQTIYSQNFAAGNSLFTATPFFLRATDGTDPLYPEVVEGGEVTVSSGTGPGGVNELDSSTGFWSNAAFWVDSIGSLSGNYFTVNQVRFRSTSRWTTAAIAEASYHNMFGLHKTAGSAATSLSVHMYDNGGTLAVDVTCERQSGLYYAVDDTLVTATYENQQVDLDFEMTMGTMVAGVPQADGFYTLKLNGVTILSASGMSFRANITDGVDHRAHGLSVGRYGIIGPTTNILLEGDDATAPTPLTAGTATASAGTGAVMVEGTVPTGGTPTYTYQWYRSTTSGFTPGAGTLLSGRTLRSFTDTDIVEGTTYYYVLRYTDSASAVAYSTEVSALPGEWPTVITAMASDFNSCVETLSVADHGPAASWPSQWGTIAVQTPRLMRVTAGSGYDGSCAVSSYRYWEGPDDHGTGDVPYRDWLGASMMLELAPCATPAAGQQRLTIRWKERRMVAESALGAGGLDFGIYNFSHYNLSPFPVNGNPVLWNFYNDLHQEQQSRGVAHQWNATEGVNVWSNQTFAHTATGDINFGNQGGFTNPLSVAGTPADGQWYQNELDIFLSSGWSDGKPTPDGKYRYRWGLVGAPLVTKLERVGQRVMDLSKPDSPFTVTSVPFTHFYNFLAGFIDDIEFGVYCEDIEDLPPDSEYVPRPTPSPLPCCGPTTTGGNAGATPRMDSTVIPVWTPMCLGGGSVPSAADILNSEDWDEAFEDVSQTIYAPYVAPVAAVVGLSEVASVAVTGTQPVASTDPLATGLTEGTDIAINGVALTAITSTDTSAVGMTETVAVTMTGTSEASPIQLGEVPVIVTSTAVTADNRVALTEAAEVAVVGATTVTATESDSLGMSEGATVSTIGGGAILLDDEATTTNRLLDESDPSVLRLGDE